MVAKQSADLSARALMAVFETSQRAPRIITELATMSALQQAAESKRRSDSSLGEAS